MTIVQRRGINATTISANACMASAGTSRPGPNGDATISPTSSQTSWVLGSELGHFTTRTLTAAPVAVQGALPTVQICACETVENDATL